jgi:hypothetical protein
MTNPPKLAAQLAAVVAGMLAALPAPASAEVFVDFGLHSTRVEADMAALPDTATTQSGIHLGAGLRRELTRGSIGARIELDDLDGDLLLAVRALDYRRHLSERFAVTAFAGAARLDVGSPAAHGYYLGGGIELKDLWPSWTLAIDLRFGDKLARDNLSPSDPPADRPDDFYDLKGLSLYLSRRF